MNEMTLNQRIIVRILNLINDYESGEVSLRRLVDGLEGSVKAMDPPLTGEEAAIFFQHWGMLEVIVATEEEEQYKEYIQESLVELRTIFSKLISKFAK